MNEHENTKIVQKTYELFKSGDISALLDMYSEDIDWQLPEVENLPFTGKRKGREAVADFFQSVNETQDVLAFNPQEFVAQGDKVVVLGDYSWQVKETGREYSSDFAHVVTVRDGKVIGFKEYMDTAASNAAFQKATSA